MSNYLVFENVLIQDGVTLENAPISGTVTEFVSINKLLTTQLADKYVYTATGNSTITIDNIPTDPSYNKIGIISIININDPTVTISSVTAYAGLTSYSTTRISRVLDKTYQAGADQRITQSSHYKIDNGNTNSIDKIEIVLVNSLSGGSQIYIGHIYAGEYVNLSIRPNVKYSSKSFTKPDISNGGQFYYQSSVSLKTIKQHVTHKTQAETSTLYQHSLNHGTSIPVIFISDSIEYQTIYGTFQTPISIMTLPSKDPSNGWRHSADISIIENK